MGCPYSHLFRDLFHRIIVTSEPNNPIHSGSLLSSGDNKTSHNKDGLDTLMVLNDSTLSFLESIFQFLGIKIWTKIVFEEVTENM